jgi:drug/metabolite transporter (DMT)-like permease
MYTLIASCAIAVAADLAFVTWAKHRNHPAWILAFAVVLLNGASVLWAHSLRMGISSASGIACYALGTVSGCSLVGFIAFKESISPTNLIGLAMALVSLLLLNSKTP